MSFQDLPLAPRDRAWDASAADARVRKWAGAEDAPNAKYAQAFFWHDGANADKFGSYKLPFADIIDGKLTAVPKGVFGAAAAIQGSRGGVKLPAGDVGAVKAHIEKYYAKMAKQFDDKDIVAPWKRSGDAGVERRTFVCDALSIEKRDDTSEAPMIRGHAAVFNSPAQIGSFREQIEPGAFSEAIKNDDVRALFNHDPNIVLGRNKAGTLRMVEDKKGLAVEIDPPDTQAARDLMTSIKRGDISQMSFGFTVMSQQWDEDPDSGEVTRTIKSVQLYDVSPVTYPAYTDTDVAVRAFDEYREEHPVEDKTTEDAGLLDLQRRRVQLAEIE